MALTLIIQYSTTGFSDSSFVDLVTLPDTGSGVFNYQHAPVIAGQLYIYRIRRRDDTQSGTCQYSDWVYKFARAPYPLSAYPGGVIMPDPIIGARTAVGVALESSEGTPVKVTKLLETKRGSFTRGLGNLFSTALRNTTAKNKKNVDGITSFTGSFEVEITPEGGFAQAIVGVFGTPTTQQMGGTAGTPVFYRHTFYDGFQRQPMTWVQQKGGQYYQYPGVTIDSITINANEEQSDVYTATINVMALDEKVYSSASQVGMDTASADVLKPFAVVDTLVYVAGTPSTKVHDANVSISSNAKAKHVLNNYRGPTQFFYTESTVSAGLTAYLSDGDNEYLSYTYGTPNFTLPMGPQRNQPAREVRLSVNSGAGGVPRAVLNPSGFANRFDVVFPQAIFNDVQDPVTGPDEIMQTAAIVPLLDPATNTDVYFVLDNSLTYAQMVATGVAVTGVPVDSVKS